MTLEKFKNYVFEVCQYPGEVEEAFESLYGYGNAPEEPTDKNWQELYEYFKSERFI